MGRNDGQACKDLPVPPEQQPTVQAEAAAEDADPGQAPADEKADPNQRSLMPVRCLTTS